MGHYIDAEKLKAEIEERLVKYDTDYTSAGSELKKLLSFINSLQQEQPEVYFEQELKDMIARNAASGWCRCFKCDGIVNTTSSKCDKEKLLTCLKWYDGYRTALLALGDKRIFNARKEDTQ